MEPEKQNSMRERWVESRMRPPVLEDATGWSATLGGLDPSGGSEDVIFQTNAAPESELPGFVPVLFAKTRQQAEWMAARLEEEDIPAVLEQDHTQATTFSTLSRGIPVLVPVEWLDHASEIIAQGEADKNPFERSHTRDKDEKDDSDRQNDDDEYEDDEDEYEDDDPFDADDPDDEDEEDDQFDYDDD